VRRQPFGKLGNAFYEVLNSKYDKYTVRDVIGGAAHGVVVDISNGV